MTSTAWQSAALICIIALWAAMIVEVFGIIVAVIVAGASARKVRSVFGQADPQKQRLGAPSRFHENVWRSKAGNVRNSLHELGAHALARELSPEFVAQAHGPRRA